MSEPSSSANPEPTPFEKMQALAARVMSVPKAEIDRREQEWKKQREEKKQAKRT